MTTPGAALAALRKQATKVCPECGTTFTARLTAVYCSQRCQKRGYRKTKPTDQLEAIAMWMRNPEEIAG